ncbi:conserved hypothetical protein [Vibrio phage 489E54-1]|nr:conserved hypothetical protein [Vibrio phage 489E54-1]
MTIKYPLLLILLASAALWFTRPATVMPHCLVNNTPFSCQYLDKE